MVTKKLYINTIGCQMNVYDSERIVGELAQLGYTVTDAPARADLIIMNTCAIREKAEQKVYSFLGRLTGLKKHNPELIIAVGGCVAQQAGKRMLRRLPFVDLVFGTDAIGRLSELVARVEEKRLRIVDVHMDNKQVNLQPPPVLTTGESVSRFVTIMQGCDNYCTYCVVPYVRGRERSRPAREIITEIAHLAEMGVQEVTLLGQNVNSYGRKEGLCSFPELLGMVNQMRGIQRIRFTTSHPKDLSQGLIDAFGSLEKLCHHIHLPVQSGSNKILRAMNRNYTRQMYLQKVRLLRQECPEIAITSDIIVGFPGEEPNDFKDTLDLIQEVGFDGLFAFKYSDRPEAPATTFDQKLSEATKQARLKKVLDLQEANTLNKHKALIGSCQQILVEGLSKRQACDSLFLETESPMSSQHPWMGRTSGNKIVNFIRPEHTSVPPIPIQTGMLVDVRIERAFSHSLWGRLSDPHARKGDQHHAA